MNNRTLIPLALVVATAIGSGALANGASFGFQGVQDASTILTVDTLQTPTDAVIEIYDYRLGEMGVLLASQPVLAGADKDLRVKLDLKPAGDVIAVLRAPSGAVLAQRVLPIAN